MFYFKIFLFWNPWLGDAADVLTPGQGLLQGLPLQLRCPCGHTVARLSLHHSVYTGLFKSRHIKGPLYSCHACLLGVHMSQALSQCRGTETRRGPARHGSGRAGGATASSPAGPSAGRASYAGPSPWGHVRSSAPGKARRGPSWKCGGPDLQVSVSSRMKLLKVCLSFSPLSDTFWVSSYLECHPQGAPEPWELGRPPQACHWHRLPTWSDGWGLQLAPEPRGWGVQLGFSHLQHVLLSVCRCPGDTRAEITTLSSLLFRFGPLVLAVLAVP